MTEFHLPDDWLTSDEKQRLMRLFNASTEDEYKEALQGVALAALYEYKEMFLGQGLPTRADEVKQHRLLYLIKHHFRGRMPSEAEVGNMFQLTDSQSRALIQNVRTRFRYELEQEMVDTLKETIERASLNKDEEEYRVVIQSDNVLDEMRRILEENAPLLEPIRKVPGSSRNYAISPDSYSELRARLGMPEEG